MRHGLGFHNRHSAFGFQPISLYTGGVAGAWYDPSDYGASGTGGVGTLFQDSAGTTPVTAVEQVVGLMLDKSQGLVLGPELVTNGDFSSGTTGWTVGTDWSISSGQASHVAGAALSNLFIANPIFVSGAWYQLTIDIVSISGGNLTVFCGDASSITFNTSGTKTMRLRAAGDLRLYIQAAAATVVTVDNISAKLLPGYHATATGTARPTLSARVNLLTKTEQFDDAAWLKVGGVSITPNATTAPNGTLTADLLSQSNLSTTHGIYQTVTSQSGTCKVRIWAKPGNGQNILQILKAGDTNGYANFDLNNGQLGSAGSSASNASITAAQNGFYECSVDLAAYGGFCYFVLAPSASATWYPSFQGSTSNGIYIWGADVRALNDGVNIPPYQRVNTATDYDTAGFPLYLSFAGAQAMSTPASINFSGTDKMLVCAGVRKLTIAPTQVLSELSTTGGAAGSFSIKAPDTGYAIDDNYGYDLTGSSAGYGSVITYVAPITNVVVGQFDIAGANVAAEIIGRVNGSQVSLTGSGGSAGTGNFGTYPLFLGARNLASLFLNGRVYGLIVAGSQYTSGQVSATEAYMNTKTKAF